MSDIVLPDRVPPQSKEAEMGVLGSILRQNDVLNEVQQVVRADNFYYDAHQKIYDAIVETLNGRRADA